MTEFIDLKTQYARIQDKVEDAVIAAMRAGNFIMGPPVIALEKRLSDYVGVRNTISCASGTDALVMALMAKGVAPGDAVFTVPFTFMASAEAIATVGATPIFVDVDPRTFNMDVAQLARAIDALKTGDRSIHPLPAMPDAELAALNPRGIIAVDLFGLPADYDTINALAKANDLFVIEDAAQSFGATCGNRRAGALAEIGCTSFFPAKPLGCFGDGGAIFTDDDELAAILRSIRVHGQGSHKYENVRLGLTGRLDTVQAAVLDVKLDIFDDEMAERQRVAAIYTAAIDRAGIDVIPPSIPDDYRSAWAQYTLLAPDAEARDIMRERLAAHDIPTMVYYPRSLHMQPVFAYLGYAENDFPISATLGDRVFSVPMHPYLDTGQIERIVAAMRG